MSKEGWVVKVWGELRGLMLREPGRHWGLCFVLFCFFKEGSEGDLWLPGEMLSVLKEQIWGPELGSPVPLSTDRQWNKTVTPTGGEAHRRGLLRLTGSQSGHISKFLKKAGGEVLRKILGVNLWAVRIGACVSAHTHTAHNHHTTHTYSTHICNTHNTHKDFS